MHRHAAAFRARLALGGALDRDHPSRGRRPGPGAAEAHGLYPLHPVVSGGETDVCVLASVLGPVDLVCSSTDRGHDAAMTLYRRRFSQQIETAPLAEVLQSWVAG
ncbi:MAG: hypothetical protein Q4615_03310 [Paracoccus aminovorans]|nr:hypothetical protein [Paracoccus aminovorans]